jgi:Flp pilus assembly protein TadD
VQRVEAQSMSADEASEYTKKLMALGYLSGAEARPLAPTGGDRPGMTEGAWNNLGLFENDSRKNAAAARRAFEKALELRPDYHSPMFNLAVLSRKQKRFDEAEDWLYRALAAGHPDAEGTLSNWAYYYQTEGHPGPERHLLERAAREFPKSERLARELSLARFRAKDCEGALEAVEALEPTTRDPDTLNALGLYRTCLGRREEAIALFRRSLEIKPGQPGVMESLRMLGAPAAPPGS